MYIKGKNNDFTVEMILKFTHNSHVQPPLCKWKLNFNNFFQIRLNIPSLVRSLSEGAVERSETEGVIKVISNYKNSPSHFLYAKNDSPLKDGAEAQIEFDIDCGQGRALSTANYI